MVGVGGTRSRSTTADRERHRWSSGAGFRFVWVLGLVCCAIFKKDVDVAYPLNFIIFLFIFDCVIVICTRET